METIIFYILLVFALAVVFYIIRGITNIYRGPDKKWTVDEFHKMLGAITLLTLSSYMIYKEGSRTDSWQLFGPLYIFLVIGGFLTVIGIDKVLEVVRNIWSKNNNKDD